MKMYFCKNKSSYTDNIHYIDIIVIHHISSKAVMIEGRFGYRKSLYVKVVFLILTYSKLVLVDFPYIIACRFDAFPT